MLNTCDLVLLLPTCTLPKLKLVGLALRVPGAVAVPESETVKLGLEALLVMVRLPLGVPAVVGANTTLNDVLAPAARVRGSVKPLTLNPVPVAVACEIVTLEPPLLVTVSERVCVSFTRTLPKLKLGVDATSAPAVVAVPDSGMERVGLEALLVRVTLPVGVPAAVGANTTLNDLLAPAARVNGTEMPLRLNPVPVAVACEMVTLDPPLLVTVSDSVWFDPTTTLPKLKLGLPAVIAPAVTAVPDKAMARDGFDASLVIAKAPVGVPDVVGVNTTLKDLLAPAAKVNGKVIPLKLNPAPVTLTCDTVTLDPPLLVIVSDKL